ncbi:MAG: DUF4352 domain-containing protein [Actinomycetia bacterium]|nr:DUF4352 domain-containing protein [Actinomycetes bacterium]MCH9701831.1 DUF4352 domain-containing protein [Actinomycetes bacterium]MCH9761668.1 DUF4352 domain-containing protein [Actinomycetes bacterium]
MTTPQPPAGWHSDPDRSGGQRYWDGHAWTEQEITAATPPPEQPSPPERGGAHRAPEDRHLLTRYLAVCAALLAMLVAVAVFAAFFADDGSIEVGALENPPTTIAPTTPGKGWGEPPTAIPAPPQSGDYTDGALAFSVDAVEITTSVASAEFPVDKTAVGEFVVVHMTVTNTSDEPTTFLGTFQKLKADDTVYSIDDEATFYTGGALAELNPGDEVDVAVVFDVPTGTDPDAIELHSDPMGSGVEVPLP